MPAPEPRSPPPEPQTIGLYITACAAGEAGPKPDAVSTIERRLSALGWHFRQRGLAFDRQDRHVATVLAGIRRTHGRPPVKKDAVLPEDVIAMLETLDRGCLRGLRDRAMLLLGFAGGLRRSEIVGLDVGADQTEDAAGWVEIFDKGIVVTLRGKTGWREVEIGRGSSDATCPVVALRTWLKLARIGHGPLFRRVRGNGKDVGPDRLTDKQVARLVKGRPSPPASVGISPKATGKGNSPATRCAPASPPRPRSTSATSRSSSAMPAPR